MDLDAYGDDMARFLRLSDEDVERLFRGLAPEPDEDLRDLAGFLVDATEGLSRPPRSDVEARHLAHLAEAARSRPADVQGSPVPMGHRTVRWAAKVVVTAAGMVIATAALALAGVDLPGTAAETAFQNVLGVELPNQNQGAADAVDPAKLPSDASDTAVGVLTVIQEWFSGAEWSGCEFGTQVSQAAGGEGTPDTSHCGSATAGGPQGSQGVGAGASANAEKGLEKADEASGGAASGGAAEAEAGLGTAEEASSDGTGAGANAGS